MDVFSYKNPLKDIIKLFRRRHVLSSFCCACMNVFLCFYNFAFKACMLIPNCGNAMCK